ncbi:GH92 family glycosyl hydrolase [Mucilaginibacter sp. PAMB04274]|uniref:GH92 family glycosyl hydrolase n=1 Tax=Mucilaginibacter sp. PAMB04274 TaxID=3138568 RepID=UPI0031F6956C
MNQWYKIVIALVLNCSLAGAQHKAVTQVPNLTQYVNPMIGTGFHGHVFVGANVPFGAVQLGPTNIGEGWDWSSGYHYSDSTIVGFQHTHLSGTGIGDLGDISIMPITGPINVFKGNLKNKAGGYYSLFSHKEEVVKPGYYKVRLSKYDIQAELTATTRVGFHQYTFPKSSQAHIIIDLGAGIADHATETYIKQVNATTVTGYRFSKGWASKQRIYFAAVFSKAPSGFGIYEDTTRITGIQHKGINVKGVVSYAVQPGEKILVKVGISPVSAENALLNIDRELPDWNFKQIVSAADEAWNKQLQTILIKTDSATQRIKFYTAMYHNLMAPSVFNDVNGQYQGTDGKLHIAPFTNLTTFSLWDTYRAANPLYTLTQPKQVGHMINSMLAIYQQQGKLPVWHLMANETNTMVGNSAIPVVADAFLKGIKSFDKNLAYEAVKATAMRNDRGLNFVKTLGYIPADSTVESVAMGLEYAIDDWCIAQMALKMNKLSDYAYFKKRSSYYRNYFNKETNFMQGRVSKTQWRTPFSPFVSRHMKDDYTEGNAWQYTWLVPHDVEGLTELLGGQTAFSSKLDSFFLAKGDMGKEVSGDISGLIGQYAHGNEPSHHIAYLYAYAGKPWRTAKQVRYILNKFYTTKPDGIIGNEDVGQMSAWYIFSSLGFYPANPANGAYVFGSPTVNEAVLNLPGGKVFNISVKNNSPVNIYIQKVLLNGVRYNQSYLPHKTIVAGGNMVIVMGSKPSPIWGVSKQDRPVSSKVYQ